MNAAFAHRTENASTHSTVADAPRVQMADHTSLDVANTHAGMAASKLQLSALDQALLQFRATIAGRSGDDGDPHATARQGMSGSAGTLPYLDQIQRSFGRHDVSSVPAFTDGAADIASRGLGARAYATDGAVVLGRDGQDLHTVAHEAAHVIQQRSGVALAGGVGRSGDRYEIHADAVADKVVAGQSAESLLDRFSGGGGSSSTAVQRYDGDDTVDMDSDEDVEAEGGDYSLEDLLGEDYTTDRDARSDAFWNAHYSIHQMLGEVASRSPREHEDLSWIIEDMEATVDVDIPGAEHDLVAAANCGDATAEDDLITEIEHLLADVDDAAELFGKAAALWAIIATLPMAHDFEQLLKDWLEDMEKWDTEAQEAVDLLAEVEKELATHKEELTEAGMKIGVDVVLIGAGIAAAACLTGPAAVGASIVLTVGGLAAKFAIEGDVSTWGGIKATLNGANITNNVKEFLTLSEGLKTASKGIGPALNAITLIIDAAEAGEEMGHIRVLRDKLELLDGKYGKLVAIWPEVQATIGVLEPWLTELGAKLDSDYERMEVLDADVQRLMDYFLS